MKPDQQDRHVHSIRVEEVRLARDFKAAGLDRCMGQCLTCGKVINLLGSRNLDDAHGRTGA